MTLKEFRRLPLGTTVQWEDGCSQGKVVIGRVPNFSAGFTAPIKHVAWYWDGKPDGQVTLAHEPAMKRVIVT